LFKKSVTLLYQSCNGYLVSGCLKPNKLPEWRVLHRREQDSELETQASSRGLNVVAVGAQHWFCAGFSHLPNENNGSSLLCELLRNVGLSLG